jgi:hypothetical protein
MKSSRVVLAVLLATFLACTVSAATVVRPVAASSDSHISESGSIKVSDSSAPLTSARPVVAVLGLLFFGTLLVLVTGTGRESLDSVDFERAYRSGHETTQA